MIDGRSRVINIYDFDLDAVLGQPSDTSVNYTTAKVVLVGESNVGKSYLAHRIATGSPPEEGLIKSTHGLAIWPIELQRLAPASAVPSGQKRDVLLWDMGGQEEYRLIHQLFLDDTTVALMLLDPTRGTAAFKEVETWNKSLEKQLRGRSAVKLLVGAKLDSPSDTIDLQGLDRLIKDGRFSGYYETSAISGRGLSEFCDALADAIDWDSLGKTSRSALFQSIREDLELRRRRGDIVILFDDLDQDFHRNKNSPVFKLMQREIATMHDVKAGTRALSAVCNRLAQQGFIADCRTSDKRRALVFQVHEIERYAGSLIIAARNNPRGVPALELKAIGTASFHFPGISSHERLSRVQEEPVLECTVQLLLEHGICFEHEGLLVFPSLFAAAAASTDDRLGHSVSLYYDFAGAIDNVYASLVAWLVLARDFGKVRLWSDRAEFEAKEGGKCGLRKMARPGGFAHVDVYFSADTPEPRRNEFISFVEDHLARNGVEIHEHLVIKCGNCGHTFDEEALRQRIARGEKDVLCSVCETRHGLTEGAAQARARNPKITHDTWALRTRIEGVREEIAERAVALLSRPQDTGAATRPIRLLHLSDLHFTKDTPVTARLQWLLDDIKQDSGLGFRELDYLVISGDFTHRGSADGFEKAYEFVSRLTKEFDLSAERCVFVPGNHDLCDRHDAYEWRDNKDGVDDGDWVKEGNIFLIRDPARHILQLQPFSDRFFHKFLQRPYPLKPSEQGLAIPFFETGLQFIALNSCWQIDRFHRKRASIHVDAVATAIGQSQKQEERARTVGQLGERMSLLRISVFHHAVTGPEQIGRTEFLGNLHKNGVRLALHGDVHEGRHEIVPYRRERDVYVIGAGSFGARPEDRPESTPRLYNLLEIARDLKSARVHTRCQPKTDGPWDGWHEWDAPDGGRGRVAFYDIKF
jgi:GTPase SAR1 family protein